MHLRIIIYLLQFLLCLIQVLLLFHRIRKQRRQMRQSLTHLTTIRFRKTTPVSTIRLPPCTMDATTTSNPAYNVPAFNRRKQLVDIHCHLTDFLHYQSHIRLDAATSLPPGTLHTDRNERKAIIALLKEEHLHLQTLKQLIDCIDMNTGKILNLYEELKVTHNEDWGALAWGPLLDWEQQQLQPPNPPPANKE